MVKSLKTKQFFADPGRVLTHVNRRFPMDIERGEYFTSVYGVIDTQAGELRYAGAGHPSPVIRRPNGSVVRLATDGFPIGFDDSVDYETQRIPFHLGERLCVYSDGVLEAANASGEMYGLDRLIANLDATENLSVQGAISDLVSQRAAWEAGQADDVSIILIDFAAKTARDSSEPAEPRNHMAPTPPIEL